MTADRQAPDTQARSSIFEQEREMAEAKGYKRGTDWGRQLAQCADDDGYERGLREGSSKATENDRRLQFLEGTLFGIVLGAGGLFALFLHYGALA